MLHKKITCINLQTLITTLYLLFGPTTGKTLLCTQMGIKSFMEREVKKIVITRPAVSVDEQHGFLQDLKEKMAPDETNLRYL